MSYAHIRTVASLFLVASAFWAAGGRAEEQAAAAAPAAAEPTAAEPASVRTVTPQAVYAQQTAYRDQLLVGEGRFRAMTGAQRNQLAKRQRQVIETVRNLRSFDDLRPDQRTALFNDLQWINAQITGNDSERKVCEFTHTVGSRIDHSVCMTAEQAEEYRRRTQMELRKAYKCDDCKG